MEVTDIRVTSTEDLVIAYRITDGDSVRCRVVTPMIINLPTRTYDLGSTDDTPTWD